MLLENGFSAGGRSIGITEGRPADERQRRSGGSNRAGGDAEADHDPAF